MSLTQAGMVSEAQPPASTSSRLPDQADRGADGEGVAATNTTPLRPLLATGVTVESLPISIAA